jgi:N-acetylglutamate synthase
MLLQATNLEVIQILEELAANAWCPGVAQAVDGWRIRFNEGVTRRANSVLPEAHGGRMELSDKLTLAETFYASRNLPPRFQICDAAQPGGLDAVLARRGYAREGLSCVEAAPIGTVLDRTLYHPSLRLEITDRLCGEWLSTYTRVEEMPGHEAAMRRDILRRIGPRAGFALLQVDNQPAAVGLGVVERGWLGIFCMATDSRFRRRGAAATVLHELARWGKGHGAANAYLQVLEDNVPARSLYTRLGFETVYHYHYRRAPSPR